MLWADLVWSRLYTYVSFGILQVSFDILQVSFDFFEVIALCSMRSLSTYITSRSRLVSPVIRMSLLVCHRSLLTCFWCLLCAVWGLFRQILRVDLVWSRLSYECLFSHIQVSFDIFSVFAQCSIRFFFTYFMSTSRLVSSVIWMSLLAYLSLVAVCSMRHRCPKRLI